MVVREMKTFKMRDGKIIVLAHVTHITPEGQAQTRWYIHISGGFYVVAETDEMVEIANAIETADWVCCECERPLGVDGSCLNESCCEGPQEDGF